MGFFDTLRQAAQNAAKPPCEKCLQRAEVAKDIAAAFRQTILDIEHAMTLHVKTSRQLQAFKGKLLPPSDEEIELAEAQARLAEMSGDTERDIKALTLPATKPLKDLVQIWEQTAQGFLELAPSCPERYSSSKPNPPTQIP